MVGRAVFANDACAVNAEGYRQIGERNVVENMVIGALEERAVDGNERFHAIFCKASGKGNGVAFGDADVENALGKFFLEGGD